MDLYQIIDWIGLQAGFSIYRNVEATILHEVAQIIISNLMYVCWFTFFSFFSSWPLFVVNLLTARCVFIGIMNLFND